MPRSTRAANEIDAETYAWRLIRATKERELQHRIILEAASNGWMAYYIPDKVYAAIGELIRKGRMQLADPGFPDLFLLHPRWNQRFYAELKSESGDLTDAQRQWRDALLEAGEEWHCWRPRHWDDLILPRLQGVELDSTPSAGMEGEWVPPQFARFLRRRTAAASPSGGSTSPDRGARRR